MDSMMVFDNENVSVVNKEVGFSVQGGSDVTKNLFSLMAARYRKDMVYISHRLDKPTTGLVLLPKNLRTAQLLGKAMENREGLEKYYLAITEGREIQRSKGVLSSHVEWSSKHKARVSHEISGNERSQLAETGYRVLKS